jgi:hypothetical protein
MMDKMMFVIHEKKIQIYYKRLWSYSAGSLQSNL